MKRGIASRRGSRHAVLALMALAAGAGQTQTTPASPAQASAPAPATVVAQAPAPAPAPAAAARPAPPMASAAPAAVFAIRGFRIEGENPIGDADAQRVLAPFARPNATLETLQQATAALEKELRDRGYGLHRVALPPQEVGDTVKLQIVKFVVGKVNIEGRQIYDEGNIRRSLPELREGESPNFRTLAIQTAIANENPNKQVQVGLRESEEPDRIDATITVKEQRPWTLGASLSNYGTANSGRDRLTVTAGHTNLFNLDHQFIAAYTTSIDAFEDVKQLGLAYKIPLYALGGVVGASYTNSDVVGNFGTFTSTGAGHTFGLNYTQYLQPQGGRRSYVTAAIDDKVFDASRINGVVVPGVLDQARRSRPVSLGYTARTETDTAVWGYSADIAVNTVSGDHNNLSSYRREDPRIDTAAFRVLHGAASYTAPFAQTWTWSARGMAQYSPQVLISGEQFGLGGPFSVRGTEIERPISADKGISATFEVTSPDLGIPGLRGIGFVDAGYLSNNKPNGTTKPSSDHLASVGLGLHYTRGIWAMSAEYGRIVLGSTVPLSFNSSAPKSGDGRFYFSFSVRL